LRRSRGFSGHDDRRGVLKLRIDLDEGKIASKYLTQITQRRIEATDYTERKDFWPLRGIDFDTLFGALYFSFLCNLWLLFSSV
jgi:hypothetical protein